MKNYPLESYLRQKNEIDTAIAKVLASGFYILGGEVVAFEQDFAGYLGVNHAVGLANGTDALQVALRAGGIRSGDEVITVSNTAVATVAAIEMVGAQPVLVDIDPMRYTLDPDLLVEAISEKTKAVIAVHLYGHPADIYAIKTICEDHSVLLIEDCAQAHGAMIEGKKVGTIGDYGAFSFYPTKNLGAIGDGGMLVTNNTESADRIRALRQYGWIERNNSSEPGVNSRLDEIQAAILRVKLPYLDLDNEFRRRVAQIYTDTIDYSSVLTPTQATNCLHVYHQYVIQANDRDGLRKHLKEQGIDTQVHYPIPIHLQDAYRGRIQQSGNLEVTECLSERILSLPMHPYLTETEIYEICNKINSF